MFESLPTVPVYKRKMNPKTIEINKNIQSYKEEIVNRII